MSSPYRRLYAYEASVRLGREVHEAVATWRSLDQGTVGVQREAPF